MRFKATLALAGLALFATARAQEEPPQDPQLIDEFVTTRGFVFVEPKKPGTRPGPKGVAQQQRPRPRPARKGAPASNEEMPPPPPPAPGAEIAGGVPAQKAAAGARPIALGYTLYRREAGRFVATDESHQFTRNERLRLFLETNTDGYVYVFNTTDGATPVMLYPHAGVAGGQNQIKAHTRDYVPAGMDFEFDANPGTESVYVVVARRPLAGVPVGEELVARCAGAAEGCYWQPSAAEWSRIQATLKQGAGVREGRFARLAQLPPVRPETLTRGLRVKKEEPPPAVVRVNESAAADLLVTRIDLVHK
jgi:Domain of unknown function (DUF4384)